MRTLLAVVIVGAVLSAGVVAYSYTEELHKCTHPGMDTCPGSSEQRALHCVSCSDPEHTAGCMCVKDYPCGKEYDESAYCTPVPQY